ncbi:MAG: hypothetical protein QOH48_1576 [Actinomycetota bacterium]|jgi:hypothetical protein|nr:hypothetical protein [Actinomycetota bacterium]
MKSLPEASVPSRDSGGASPRLISGGRVIGSFVVILALLVGAFLLTRSHDRTSPPPSRAQRSTNFRLTDSQAISTFRKLNRLRIQAYRQRDPSLVADESQVTAHCEAGLTAISPASERIAFWTRRVSTLGKYGQSQMPQPKSFCVRWRSKALALSQKQDKTYHECTHLYL